jgi:HAD superfamily hydrolase (TIGR01509 family)
VRAILFDFNGVLVDDEPLHFDLLRRVLGEEGLDLDEEEYWAEYVGYDDRAAIRLFLERAGRPAAAVQVTRLGVRKAAYYRDFIQEHGYRFFPGALELVRSAAAAHMTLGLVSGALRSEIEPALRQAQLLGVFKALVAAEDVQESKPSPEGYRLGIQQLNTRPPLPERLFHAHEVVAIEDTTAGLEAAREAGLRTLGVAHTHGHDHLRGAERVAESLDEVTVDWLLQAFP